MRFGKFKVYWMLIQVWPVYQKGVALLVSKGFTLKEWATLSKGLVFRKNYRMS